MKIALVYDRVNKWGGAERVLLALHKMFPDAPLYTSVYDRGAKWANDFTVKTTFLQRWSFARRNHELIPMLMPIAFETLDFKDFELVISVTSEAAKGILTAPGTRHLCICLTPTRYLWSGYDEYFKSPFKRILAKPIVWYLRKWDLVASERPDGYISISCTVQQRVKKYYGRESSVVYPAVYGERQLNPALDKQLSNEKYFLFVSRLSRLVPYKKVDLVLETFSKLNLKLKVIGEGRDLEHYKSKAGVNIEFLGRLTDQDLFTYYKNAQALVFPALEDFGLVMVEAQSMGTPVIAYRGGGAEEIVVEGKTGEFFEKQTVSDLAGVLQKFDRRTYNTNHCKENAHRFSFDQFEEGIREAIAIL